MGTPAEPIAVQEQAIEQRLFDCGLDRKGFTVRYEEYLQSIEIVISPSAGAKEEHFSCIREAAGYGIVTFEDRGMHVAYDDVVAELVRPQMLEDATERLERLGLLAGFPERSAFSSLEFYAVAIETHCGIPPKSALRVDGEMIVFDPPRNQTGYADFADQYANLIASIVYAVARGDFRNFGFIGNGKVAEPEG